VPVWRWEERPWCSSIQATVQRVHPFHTLSVLQIRSAQCGWLLYNSADYSIKSDLQCPLRHVLSSAPSSPLPLPPRNLSFFHFAQLSAPLKRVVSFSLSIAASAPFAFFIVGPLWLHPQNIPSSCSPLRLLSFPLVLAISRHPSALLHVGQVPNLKGNKSIQRENDVTPRRPYRLAFSLPALRPRVVSSSARRVLLALISPDTSLQPY